MRMLSVVWLVVATAWGATSGFASAAALCLSRDAAAQLLAPAVARNGIAMVRFDLHASATDVRYLRDGGILKSDARGEYVLTPKGRAIAKPDSPGRFKVAVGTYLLAYVNAISAVRDDRCSVDFAVTLFLSDLGRLFQQDEAHTRVWTANADLFNNHESTTTLVYRRDAWRVDDADLLPWMHR
jgi:hypothetical protein